MKIACTVEVLTLNSAKTLGRCLASLEDFDDVLVIDGNSTDETVAIAKMFGARVLQQSDSGEKNFRIENFSAVRNYGITAARHRWFLFVDSDEYLSNEAAEEIRRVVERGDTNTEFVYRMPRKYVVNGVIIERSSMYPNYQTRFFYLPAVEGFVKPIHEKLRIRAGYTLGTLTHPTYVPFENQDHIIEKWKRYAMLQVVQSPVSRKALLWYTAVNVFESCKYILKYMRSVFGTGSHMPFVYEWHNMLYHLRLVRHAWWTAMRP